MQMGQEGGRAGRREVGTWVRGEGGPSQEVWAVGVGGVETREELGREQDTLIPRAAGDGSRTRETACFWLGRGSEVFRSKVMSQRECHARETPVEGAQGTVATCACVQRRGRCWSRGRGHRGVGRWGGRGD